MPTIGSGLELGIASLNPWKKHFQESQTLAVQSIHRVAQPDERLQTKLCVTVINKQEAS